MTIGFPTTANTGDVYTYQGRSWYYNGTGWAVKQNPLTYTDIVNTLGFQPYPLESGNNLAATKLDATNGLLISAREKVNVVAAAAAANLTFDVMSESIKYYSSNATSTWNVNIRGSSTATFDYYMTTGQSLTAALLTEQGAPSYNLRSLTIDNAPITINWINGTAPTGTNNSIDSYTFTIIKTAANAYTVLGSKTSYR